MFGYTIAFIGLAVVSGVFGFSGFAEAARPFAQILFFLFLAIGIVSAILGHEGKRDSDF